MAKKQRETVATTIRIPLSLHRELDQLAKRGNKSLNTVICEVLDRQFMTRDEIEQRLEVIQSAQLSLMDMLTFQQQFLREAMTQLLIINPPQSARTVEEARIQKAKADERVNVLVKVSKHRLDAGTDVWGQEEHDDATDEKKK